MRVPEYRYIDTHVYVYIYIYICYVAWIYTYITQRAVTNYSMMSVAPYGYHRCETAMFVLYDCCISDAKALCL
jgi:hypothetical protein